MITTVTMVTMFIDDEIDNSEVNSDNLFCVACNELFKTAKA